MRACTITVPSSTANLGPGFDSIGMALNKYLTLQVEEHSEWVFKHHSVHLPPAPPLQEHLIYQAAEHTARRFNATLPPCKVSVFSEIPLARGMGSSASAIVAGVELANWLCGLALSDSDKLASATELEGHPDNVAPAIFGGLVINAQTRDGDIHYVQVYDLDLDLILYIPDFELKTEAARKVLPDHYARSEAASAGGIGNVFVASLLTGNFETAGNMMEQDLFHEPYRATLIPLYESIRKEAKSLGAYGTVISGAGPTMISLVPKGKGKAISAIMKELLPSYSVEVIRMDLDGTRVELNAGVPNSVHGF